MTDQKRNPSHAQLIQLQTWYRRVCDLQALKCNGTIKARIDTDTGKLDGFIVVHSPGANRSLRLMSVAEGWLISAWQAEQLDWQLNHSLAGEPMLRFIEHATLTYLVDARPTQAHSTPTMKVRTQSPHSGKRAPAH